MTLTSLRSGRPSFRRHLCCSLAVHMTALFFILSFPVLQGGVTADPFDGRIVYVKIEQPGHSLPAQTAPQKSKAHRGKPAGRRDVGDKDAVRPETGKDAAEAVPSGSAVITQGASEEKPAAGPKYAQGASTAGEKPMSSSAVEEADADKAAVAAETAASVLTVDSPSAVQSAEAITIQKNKVSSETPEQNGPGVSKPAKPADRHALPAVATADKEISDKRINSLSEMKAGSAINPSVMDDRPAASEPRIEVPTTPHAEMASSGDKEAKPGPEAAGSGKAVGGQGAAPLDRQETTKALGISAAPKSLPKDMKIFLTMPMDACRRITTALYRKAHPADRPARSKQSGQEVKVADMETAALGATEDGRMEKKVLTVATAEKGTYTLLVENRDDKPCVLRLSFSLYGDTWRERKKDYAAVALPPAASRKYMFILPESVFWDDEDYFSGTVEDSQTLTKFNYTKGLVWKEEKEF